MAESEISGEKQGSATYRVARIDEIDKSDVDLPNDLLSPDLSSGVDSRAFEFRMEHYSGPIPHPAVLAGYESVHPGFADRILRMAEKQQDHRIDIEKTVVASNTKRSAQGLYAGVVVTIGCLGTAGYFAHLGHAAIGAALFGTTMLSVIGIFVTGKYQQKQDLAAKAKLVPGIESSHKDKKAISTGKPGDKKISPKANDDPHGEED